MTVQGYKGKVLVSIREYYEEPKTRERKPSRKGISLTLEQWKRLKAHIPTVDRRIRKLS